MKTTRNLPKEVMENLADQANIHRLLNHPRITNALPGEFVQSLGPAKRQILKNLKSEDIVNTRWPR